MKTWTSILAAGAILAFAAPAGYAANSQIPPDPAGNTSAVIKALPDAVVEKTTRLEQLIARSKQLAVDNKRLAAEIKALEAKLKALRAQRNPVVVGRNIATPWQPVGVPSDQANLDDCVTYKTGCTHEQLCADWGLSCNLVPPPVAATIEESPVVPPAADSAQAGSSPAELAPVGLATSLLDLGYDYSDC